MAQGLLEGLALGDVLQLRDVVKRRAVVVAHERNGDDRRDGLTGSIEVALLDLVGGDLAGGQLILLAAVVGYLVGVDDPVKTLADQLLRGVTRDLTERAVHKQPTSFAIEQAGAD